MDKLSLEEIREKIYLFSLIDILKSKKLTYDFVCKYILNPDFQLSAAEEAINIELVCLYQPHLLYDFANTSKQNIVKNSSWPNFEQYALEEDLRSRTIKETHKHSSCPNLENYTKK